MAHQDAELTRLSWVYGFNRGIYMTPGRDEQWTLSVQHTEDDVDHVRGGVRGDGPGADPERPESTRGRLRVIPDGHSGLRPAILEA